MEVHLTYAATGVVITGPANVLRNMMFLIGNIVWPGWCEDEKGREIYLGYADGCKDGQVTVARKGFFDLAWENVRKHLEIDGVTIVEIKPENEVA